MSQRIILFKAKRTDNGEWVQGVPTYPTHEPGKCYMVTRVSCMDERLGYGNRVNALLIHDAYEVDPRTVCQYTGLTDKNGKKIFEGDVLSFYNDKPFTPWVAEVKWMHCEYYLDGVNRPSRVFLSDFLPEELTIIGNIYDN